MKQTDFNPLYPLNLVNKTYREMAEVSVDQAKDRKGLQLALDFQAVDITSV